MVQGRRSVDYGSPPSSNMRLPYYAEDMAVAYAKNSSHSCSASSSPRQIYDPRVLRFIDQSASESEDEFIPLTPFCIGLYYSMNCTSFWLLFLVFWSSSASEF
jgi:hypothetical protein